VILVVGLKLGCISHALLTEEAIINKGCRIAGWVGNNISPNFEEAGENLQALKERMQSSCIGCFEYQLITQDGDEPEGINTTNMLDYLVKFR
jgi:dethiobiotin synthetase